MVILSSCSYRTIPNESPTRAEIPPRTFPDYISSNKKGTKLYIVKKNDSLWKIAKMHNCGIEEILKENKLTTKNLRIGQKIVIPFSKNKIGVVFLWPVKGEIVDSFGKNINNLTNKGVNIKVSGKEEVIASENGNVIFSNPINGWGHTIIIQHPSNLYTIYTNLSNTIVKKGVNVKKGQSIAKVASNNQNGDCVLHFEIRKKHLPQNPLYYLE